MVLDDNPELCRVEVVVPQELAGELVGIIGTFATDHGLNDVPISTEPFDAAPRIDGKLLNLDRAMQAEDPQTGQTHWVITTGHVMKFAEGGELFQPKFVIRTMGALSREPVLNKAVPVGDYLHLNDDIPTNDWGIRVDNLGRLIRALERGWLKFYNFGDEGLKLLKAYQEALFLEEE